MNNAFSEAVELLIQYNKDEEEANKNRILEHARTELFLANLLATDPTSIQNKISNCTLKIIESCSYIEGLANEEILDRTLDLVCKLLKWKPLTPLTGDEKEWEDISDDYCLQPGELYINKRYRAVIKKKDGTAIDTQAYLYQTSDGHKELNINSSKQITFPYEPKQEVVLVTPQIKNPDGTIASESVILQ